MREARAEGEPAITSLLRHFSFQHKRSFEGWFLAGGPVCTRYPFSICVRFSIVYLLSYKSVHVEVVTHTVTAGKIAFALVADSCTNFTLSGYL